MQAQGVTVQKKSTAILQIVTLTSPDGRYDSLYLANYATIRLKDEIARLPGVGNVSVFGAGQYSMRVWLDPDKMQARGLTAQDVIQALQQQSQQVTAGQIGTPPAPDGADVPIHAQRRRAGSTIPTSSTNVIVKTGDRPARSPACATSAGSSSARRPTARSSRSTASRPPASRSSSRRAPTRSNVAKRGQAQDERAGDGVSAGHGLRQCRSTPPCSSAQSINEVYKTLIEAAVLVLIVILVFLQDWRAMLVPATTVPVTIIGAFAAMAALGFTVNLSTLFAIVLAIGIVVDDAIVVVEGAAHNIEKGMSGHDAAIEAMDAAVRPDHRHHAGADGGVPAGRVPARPDRPACTRSSRW